MSFVIFTLCVFSATIGHAQHGTATGNDVVAIAGDTEITRAELESAFARSVRQKYYHGKPPENELRGVRRNVANELIERSLLLQQARRDGLEPDRNKIEAELDVYRKRYASSPRWQAQQEDMEKKIATYLGEKDLLQQIETRVRAVQPPNEEQLRAFYATNKDKFTEPEQDHLSLILLKVPPSAPREEWQDALARAAGLVAELRSGADFAALARANSDDQSASRGGDMGYLHRGMLSPAAQGVVESLEPRAISDPVRLLDGIAVFRVEDRKLARLRDFEDVRPRAEQLWKRWQSDEAWREYKQSLVAKGPVRILDQSLLADN